MKLRIKGGLTQRNPVGDYFKPLCNLNGPASGCLCIIVILAKFLSVKARGGSWAWCQPYRLEDP